MMEDHADEHFAQDANRASIQEAAAEEMRKVVVNLNDLESAQSALREEQVLLDGVIRVRQTSFEQVEETIRQELRPRLAAGREELERLIELRVRMLDQQSAHQRLVHLVVGHAALGPEPKGTRGVPKPSPKPPALNLRQFADTLAEILQDWRYLKKGEGVAFDAEMDLVAAGNPRQNRGKGIRAVLHSAFTIGLMRHCHSRELNHPGIVVLDSPLTSYKEAARYEVEADIQEGFFHSLARLPKTQQVIILENREPPSGIKDAFHQIYFSGTEGIERKGFIPER